MNRHNLAPALALVFLLTTTLMAQSQHVNNARGFTPNGVYANYDIDHINLFNGNLIIAIPVGQTYPVNGKLSYSFKLVYNSFIWSRESTCFGSDGGATGLSAIYAPLVGLQRGTFCTATGSSGRIRVCEDHSDGLYVVQPPLIDPSVLINQGRQPEPRDQCQPFTTINPASNAGVGWQLHLGKLFRPRDDIRDGTAISTEKLDEVYQSPDGSDHEFFGKLHEDDDIDHPDIYYTRDSSYLRMWRNPNPSVQGNYQACHDEPGTCYTPEYSYVIDFPNGEKHYFQRIRVDDGFSLNGGYTTNPVWEDKLVRIEDQFGNWVQIDYYDDATDADALLDNRWLIRDSVGRAHEFLFLKSGSATMIDKIILEAVNGTRETYDLDYAKDLLGQIETKVTDVSIPHALQGFGIEGQNFTLPGYSYKPDGTATMLLPYLTEIKLPDQSKYSMPYPGAYRTEIPTAGALAPGALIELTLPTGGRLQWDYRKITNDGYGYYFEQGSSGRQYARVSPGVRERRLYAGQTEDSLIGTWKYDPKLGSLPNIPGCHQANLHEPCGSYDIVNRVTQPTLDYTDYFFSVYPYPGRRTSPPDPRHRLLTDPHMADYGLPFSKDPRNSGELARISQDPLDPSFTEDKPLFISSITYDSKGRIKRKTYVRYEGDTYGFSEGFAIQDQYNPRLEATRTVYREEDQPDRYTEVQYSDFDGLGHYRTMRTSGNLGNSSSLDGTEIVNNNRRTEFTNYNPQRGTYKINPLLNARDASFSYDEFPEGPAGPAGPYGPARPKWVLGNYTEVRATEFGERSTSYFRFDDKGMLQAKRVVKAIANETAPASLGTNDVLTNYGYDEKGNLTSESVFGGDRPGHLLLDTTISNPAPTLSSGSEYRITYKYHCGGGGNTTSTVAQKLYEAAAMDGRFNVIDNTVDCSTGLVTASKDSSGLSTTYLYGVMSRLEEIHPAQGAYERIKYEPFTGGPLPRVTVWSLDRTNPNPNVAASVLSKKEYIYDSLGRLITERRLGHNGVLQEKVTVYNAMGWVLNVSEWANASEYGDGIKTIYENFDPFGRPTSIRLPDRTFTTVQYLGIYQVTRTVQVGTGIASDGTILQQGSRTTEVYDRQGRLIKLTEPARANGQNTDWHYTYNVNGQLTKASGSDAAQGAAQIRTFSYDNLGNLLDQSLPEQPSSEFLDYDTMGNVGKTFDGKNWLTYTYDTHGRIKEIRAQDEATGQRPLLKSYRYYTDNNEDANGNPSPGNRGLGKMAAATRNNRINNPWEIENVSIGKNAAQSSTISGGSAARAVDGNTNGNFAANSVTHTNSTLEPWWQVDLGSNRAVEQIRIWNRTDGDFSNRLTNFYVLVSDNPITPAGLTAARQQPGVSSYHVAGTAGVPTKINIGRTGRYVRVQLAGTNYLSLAEVEVMANALTVYDVNVNEEYVYAGVDGRLSKQITKLNAASSGAHTFEQSFVYDQLGNLRTQDYPRCTSAPCASTSNPGGSQARPWTVHYNYTRGWLTSIGSTATTTNNNYASAISYNSNGTINTIAHGNGVVDTTTKDPNNMQRPARIQAGKAGQTPLWDSGADASGSDVNYKYDGAGNITRIGRDWYLYDKVSRIVEGSVRSIEQKKKYSYDVFGNILTVTTLGGVTTYTNGVQLGNVFVSNTNSATNRYTLNYDDAGNLTGMLGENNQPAPPPTYTYDPMNMIRTAQAPGIQLTHLYGPDDERVWTIEKRMNNLISTVEPSQPPPTVTIEDVTLNEGNSGSANAVLAVSLSAVSVNTVTVNYATANDSALAGSDYTAASDTLVFSPGQTTKNISVPVTGDTTFEGNEIFSVNLTSATNAIIADSQGHVRINNDDSAPQPALTINDVSLGEGNSGVTNFVFTVSLSHAGSSTVTVNYNTGNGTAFAGSDYVAHNSNVTFDTGQTSKTISVAVNGDTSAENDETFVINLLSATGAVIVDSQGLGIINDDDATNQPSLTINDISVPEGNSGFTSFVFTVNLSAVAANTVTVNYVTANNTAESGSDYNTANGTLTFSPGQTTKTVSVPVIGDTTVESNETFFLNLSNASNAIIGDSQALGFINNDDAAPAPTPATTRFWSFDENGGEIAADTSGNGQHFGIFQNGTRWIAGMVNTGAAFDGLDDEVTTTGTDLVNNFTVSFWAMPANTHQIDNESNTNVGGTSGQRYALWPTFYSEAGQAGAGISVGTNGVSVYEHGTGYMPALLVYPTTINRWTHVAVVYENKKPKLYLNGLLVRTGMQSLRSIVHLNPSQIGGGSYGHYAGGLDDLRLFDRALNANEVRSLVVPAGSPGPEAVWVEDSLPAGATTGGSDESWHWIQSNPGPVSGTKSHQSSINSDRHQHVFSGANNPISVGVGEMMFAWVYLDPANPPREIMLQWNVNGSWDHRAYWGENLINWGINMQNSRRPAGYLPVAGQWVRLEIPAKAVGLEGKTVNGMAFTLFGGRAAWDRAGTYERLVPIFELESGTEDEEGEKPGNDAEPLPMEFNWIARGG